MGILQIIGKAITSSALIFVVVVLVPGVPPDVEFEVINAKLPLELNGKLAPNVVLDRASPMELDLEIEGPESIAISPNGKDIYTGIVGGEIIRVNENGQVKIIAKFGQECEGEWDILKCGRVAGLRFDSNGTLFAADVALGVFKVNVDTGAYEQVVPMDIPIDGKLIKFADDLDIDKDGRIYFSDASTNVDPSLMILELLGPPSGRLIQFDPKTRTSKVLIDNLHFANGVQLSRDEDFVMVAELVRSRVWRYFLKGDRKGQSEIFVDQLPGLPDNIRPNGKGGYFIVLASPIRTAGAPGLIDTLGPLPLIRKFVARTVVLVHGFLTLTEMFLPSTYVHQLQFYVSHLGPLGQLNMQPTDVIIVEIDNSGKIIGSFHNKNGPISHSSEVQVGKEFTYFGSASAKHIYRMKTSDFKL
ncbi:hypothetical protein HA402_014437 [Bradysia odoriphaga]|nr:hypothetical protein HA402_014437 [Bradysia odoriphaga]